jgi:hypothetical protein
MNSVGLISAQPSYRRGEARARSRCWSCKKALDALNNLKGIQRTIPCVTDIHKKTPSSSISLRPEVHDVARRRTELRRTHTGHDT